MMRLAREFSRADWRRMLSEMSATELGEWGEFYREHPFSDALLDAEFATLKSLMVSLASSENDAAAEDFLLLHETTGISEKSDEELMTLGAGISGGVRYGPDSKPGH